MALAAIALGSNLPGIFENPGQNLSAAVKELRRFGTVRAVSRFIQTEPVGYLDQPAFVNGAILLETELAPEALLDTLLAVERELGRDRSHGIAKGPRTLDLDLLLYDAEVHTTPRLVLPHPEMHRRRFVLEPLEEIAPGWMHPILHRSVRELLANLDAGVF